MKKMSKDFSEKKKPTKRKKTKLFSRLKRNRKRQRKNAEEKFNLSISCVYRCECEHVYARRSTDFMLSMMIMPFYLLHFSTVFRWNRIGKNDQWEHGARKKKWTNYMSMLILFFSQSFSMVFFPRKQSTNVKAKRSTKIEWIQNEVPNRKWHALVFLHLFIGCGHFIRLFHMFFISSVIYFYHWIGHWHNKMFWNGNNRENSKLWKKKRGKTKRKCGKRFSYYLILDLNDECDFQKWHFLLRSSSVRLLSVYKSSCFQ